MGVELKGTDKLLKELEERLGKQAMQRISDKALLDGANLFVEELKKQFENFKDTGASIAEITITGPLWEAGERTVKIHWKGPKGRYRIIHLNEWGTIKNPNPRGKGAIARALKNSEIAYHQAIKKALQEGL